MKRLLIVFVLCLLVSANAFSQNGYPKASLINGDTVVLITVPQMDFLNELSIKYQNASQQLQNCEETEVLMQSNIAYQDSIISAQERVQSLMLAQAKNSLDLIDVLSKENNRSARKINWLRWQRNGLGALLFGAVAYIVLSK